MPDDTSFDYEGDYFYANNGSSERLFHAGGAYGNGAGAGVFYLYGHDGRSYRGGHIGFRSAFVNLPTA